MGYTNSSLVNCVVKSPNHSGRRTHSIDRITPHCVVGQLTAEEIGNCFPSGKKASCNYGIGKDGCICLIVDEANRSWCSSNNANDQRAVTIECASDVSEPYAMNSKVYEKLITLCVDICKRNGKKKLLWFADKNKSLNYKPKSDEMVLTVHRWFASKSCPGDWLYARLGDLASKVTKQLQNKAGWILDDNGWWYCHVDGSYTTNNWEKINGVWYYFDSNGYMVIGWQKIGDYWYYMDESGAMKTGWQYINGNWFYLKTDGAMANNEWYKDENGKWYWLKEGGYMAHDEMVWVGNEMFYFMSDGHMARTDDRGALV